MEHEEKTKDNNEDAAIKPDAETLHTTDPQEHMKGPISSLMQDVKEGFEENDKKEKKDEDEKDDK